MERTTVVHEKLIAEVTCRTHFDFDMESLVGRDFARVTQSAFQMPFYKKVSKLRLSQRVKSFQLLIVLKLEQKLGFALACIELKTVSQSEKIWKKNCIST